MRGESSELRQTPYAGEFMKSAVLALGTCAVLAVAVGANAQDEEATGDDVASETPEASRHPTRLTAQVSVLQAQWNHLYN